MALAGAAAFAPAIASAQADETLPPERFSVESEAPPTGSRIPKTVVHGARIPLNRTYAQLTEAEKRIVKGQYEVMGKDDEPPFPLEGLFPLYRDVQKLVQLGGAPRGLMALVANVDASGAVTSVDSLSPGDPDLTQRAAQLLMLTRFKPALCGGRPCAMGFPVRMTVERTL